MCVRVKGINEMIACMLIQQHNIISGNILKVRDEKHGRLDGAPALGQQLILFSERIIFLNGKKS